MTLAIAHPQGDLFNQKASALRLPWCGLQVHVETASRFRSLERLEADRLVDYRPPFVRGDDRRAHDAVRAWVRGFLKAMELAPETWSRLAEDERTKIILAPVVAFFDLDDLAPHEVPVDIDDRLDEHAALIARRILLLRELACIAKTATGAAPFPRRGKVDRDDPCPYGSSKKYKCCRGGA